MYFRSNGYIPSYFSSFSQPNLFGKLGVGNGTQQPSMNHKTNQVSAHMSGHGHRRLPPTPNKPSTLFTQTASMAFQNFSHQFTKPSSLTFRLVFISLKDLEWFGSVSINTGCPNKFGHLTNKYQFFILNKSYFMKNFDLFTKNLRYCRF